MPCVSGMLSPLRRAQGAGPTVQAVAKRVGTSRSQPPAVSAANWSTQESQSRGVFTTSNFSSPSVSESAHGFSSAKEELAATSAARVLGVGGGTRATNKGTGALTRPAEGARPLVTLCTSVHDCSQVPVQGGRISTGRATSINRLGASSPSAQERGSADHHHHQLQHLQHRQQRRLYSSKDGFGGGQHFPHSDQVRPKVCTGRPMRSEVAVLPFAMKQYYFLQAATEPSRVQELDHWIRTAARNNRRSFSRPSNLRKALGVYPAARTSRRCYDTTLCLRAVQAVVLQL